MTDSVEAQGKTVKEAVSEGLLKMGARENEVKVTVLVQPKAGLFGFLGGKPAKVLIEKKAPRGRGGRKTVQKDDHAGHGFGGTAGGTSGGGSRQGKSTRRSGGSQSRGGQSRDGQSRDSQPRDSQSRDSQSKDSRNKPDSREKRAAKPVQEKAEKDSGRTSQRRRGGRGRGSAQDTKQNQESRTAQVAKPSTKNENRSGRNMNRNRYRHSDNDMVLDKNNPHLDEQRKHFEAAERLRKSEEVAASPVKAQRSEPRPEQRSEQRSEQRPEQHSERRSERGSNGDARRSDGRNKTRGGSRNTGRRDNTESQGYSNNGGRQEAPAARQEPQVPDEILFQGINALKYAEALRDIPLEEANSTLESVAGELFKRAGFPCRCDVVDDEYSLVRIVTDDASAGMLIGRHGSTVDAIEHLVERMSCNAVGERVRMNLDINNYRKRREEALVERVADAVQSVLSSGRPYHIEPQDARERRMVHMEALKTEGLRTYTMYGSGGKHVVIALDDKPKNKEIENDETVPESPDDSFNEVNTDENPAP